MAQYFTEFDELSIGDDISISSDWTSRVNDGGNWTKVSTGLEYLDTGTSSGDIITYDPAGSVETCEIAVNITIINRVFGTFNVRPIIRTTTSTTTKDGYLLRQRNDRTEIIEYDSDSFNNLTSTITEYAEDNYWFRLMANGNSIYGKFWNETDVEPTFWTINATNSNHPLGLVGLFGRYSSHVVFKKVGIGTNGDPAPMSPVTSAIPAAPTGLTLTEL